jgi:anti-sigma B factor antagonist
MAPAVEKAGSVTIVLIPGKSLDSGNTRSFKEHIGPIVAANHKLVFDLSELTFVDSSGLGAILSCLRQTNSAGGDLKLCGLSKGVRALFELVRMHKIFEILNTREEAIRAFGG